MIDGRLGRQRYLEVAVGTVMLTHVYKPSRGPTGQLCLTKYPQVRQYEYVVCGPCAGNFVSLSVSD